MARKISFSSEAVWYVPDIGDNRQDPEPFAVLIEPMSARDLQEHEAAQIRQMSKPKKGAFVVDPEQIEHNLYGRIFETRVKEVRGYEIRNGKGIVLKPSTGAELYAAIAEGPASERDILVDIAEAVKNMSRLEEGLEKKLRSQSGSCAQVTKAYGNGAAQSAKATPPETSFEIEEIVTESPTVTLSSPGIQVSSDVRGVS